MKNNGQNEFFRNVIFTIVTLVMIFCGIEILLRISNYGYEPTRNEMGFPWPDTGTMARSMVEDPILFWRMKPNSRWKRQGEVPVNLNSKGYRGEVYPEKKGMNEFRIICVGDSCTFGWNASIPYPKALSKLLNENESSRVYSVINFGTPGYTSYQGLKLLESEIFHYNPDVVTVFFGWNDHWYGKNFDDRHQPTRGNIIARCHDVLLKFKIYQGLSQVVNMVKKPADSGDSKSILRVSERDYKRNLESMSRLAEDHNVPILFITAPSDIRDDSFTKHFWETGAVEDIATLRKRHALYNQIVRTFTQKTNSILVDVDDTFNKNRTLTLFNDPKRDPIHPNDKGHQLIANEILHYLVSNKLVPPVKLNAIKSLKTPKQLNANSIQ